MILLLTIALICFWSAWHYRILCLKQRAGEELHARVISFETFKGWRGQAGWKYYEIIVEAENGATYKIRTDNTKAKKYQKHPEDIVIIVPEGERVFGKLTDSPSFQRLAAQDSQTAAQFATEMTQIDQLINQDRSNYPTAVIIKEDQKKMWQVWVLAIAGFWFTIGAIALVIDALK